MLMHLDNFQIYGLNGEVQLTHGVYASAAGCGVNADPDVNATGTVLQVSDFGHLLRGVRFIPPIDDVIQGVGWRWWVDSIPADTNDKPVVTIINADNTAMIFVCINLIGGIDIRIGTVTGTVVASTEGPVITPSSWYHIEVRMDASDGGDVQVRVEGRPVLTWSDTGIIATCQGFFLGMWSANGRLPNCYYKDVFMWNGAGTHNIDFLGPVIVASLLPTADVSLNWTPSTGANGYSILDNIGPNDAQFIQAPNPPPAPYVCSLSDLPLEVTSVRGIMTVVRAAKVDGGDGSLQNGVISAATPVSGSDRAITATQTYWRDIFEEDPATSAAWLPAAVNAVEMQINRTT